MKKPNIPATDAQHNGRALWSAFAQACILKDRDAAARMLPLIISARQTELDAATVSAAA